MPCIRLSLNDACAESLSEPRLSRSFVCFKGPPANLCSVPFLPVCYYQLALRPLDVSTSLPQQNLVALHSTALQSNEAARSPDTAAALHNGAGGHLTFNSAYL